MMTDLYDHWEQNLAGAQKGLKPAERGVPFHEGEPQFGFYRMRNGAAAPWQPVAIYPREEDGEMAAMVGGRPADPGEIWTRCCEHPVTEEAWRAVAEDGAAWPDDVPGLGHNRPAGDADELRDEIEAARKALADYETITSDEQLAQAQSLRSRLTELRGEVEKRHKKEKAPHLEAGRAVDKKWFPLRDLADEAAKAVVRAMEAFLAEKRRRAREEQRRQEEERRRREEEARKAAEAGKPAPQPEPEPEPDPEPEVPMTQVRGAYGRAGAVRVKPKAVIVDQDKVYAAFREHEEVKALLAKLAQRAIDAGHDVPGVKKEEEVKIR